MNDTLKEAGRIGAELRAAKAEIEALREQVKVLQSDANSWQSGYDKGRRDGARHRKSEVQQLRGLLRQATELIKEQDARLDVDMLPAGRALMKDIRAALSQQTEPTDAFTAVDMATAAAQGFRDGQAAVEQAAAQDEREVAAVIGFYEGEREPRLLSWNVLPNGEHRLYTRPAQTEQHPIYQIRPRENVRDWLDTNADGYRAAKAMASMEVRMLYAAPIAQTAPQPAPGESWIPWRGGECPLPPSTPVEYRMRWDARSVVRIDLAGKLDWEHYGGRIGKSDVVAYRAALSAQGAGDASA